MAGTTTVRRAVRLALVSTGVAGALALSGPAAFADGTPSAAPTVAAPSAAVPTPGVSAPGGTGVKPSVAPTSSAGDSQVKVVPKGGAQTGEASQGDSTGTLVLGSGLAAVGAAGIGFAVVRRRAGARG
ncbi:hypothetical protein KCMC57_up45820 [Kitasatospora sp. CMC57]|uniref:Gram-positive cocci surface proteins LPxTG domain-containing protein n=1 Tax=Kitasatospora sp. CMC57 TaxID=3231513 RepID=A0AB33K3D4_9ACTN